MDLQTITTVLMLLLMAYLAGAIPFGLLIVRTVSRRDIRHAGSGNIGATNVRRIAGTLWGIVTLVCDILKGMLPTLIALRLFPLVPSWAPPLVALAAISGHMFPIYLKFKPSGKGVATALGCFGLLAPAACGLALAVFVGIVVTKRIVSIASMIAMGLLPLLIWFTTRDSSLTAGSVPAALLIISRHRENIQRLVQGKEPTIGG